MSRPQRVELSLEGKEADEKTRREGDTLSMERKFLELMKRKLRKKRAIADAARQVCKRKQRDFRVELHAQQSTRLLFQRMFFRGLVFGATSVTSARGRLRGALRSSAR